MADKPDSHGRNLCVDGDRLCASQRRRQRRRDEQDYLSRHNPNCSLLEIGLLIMLAILLVGAIGTSMARPNPPPGQAAAEVAEANVPSDDRQDFGDAFDRRR
ncbi:hypothetical protein [Bosea sp. BK604]|uniref:hypothetical protein n=1 Tax=Bosea sp. BK604 TaxID=2512180 RepID=UPI00104795AF|nr:hypothetical protein [Bosea sp. BK604]TCR65491.1 hypothetical protein EV560_105254 [Bosea sp. BK604]